MSKKTKAEISKERDEAVQKVMDLYEEISKRQAQIDELKRELKEMADEMSDLTDDLTDVNVELEGTRALAEHYKAQLQEKIRKSSKVIGGSEQHFLMFDDKNGWRKVGSDKE